MRVRGEKNMPKNGFTLIELLIAMSILIIGLVGVLLVVPVAQRTAGAAALSTRAAMFAEEKLEELRAKSYDVLVTEATWSGVDDVFRWNAAALLANTNDFEQVVTLPSDGMLLLTLEVV